MTLSFAANNSAVAGCTDAQFYKDNLIAVLDGTNVRLYNMSTLANTSTYTTTVTYNSLTVVASASALVISTSTNIPRLIELAGGYTFSYGAVTGATVPSSLKASQGAYSSIHGVALICATSPGQLAKMNASTYTLTVATYAFLSTQQAKCIITLPNGNFLIGTDSHQLIEVNGTPSAIRNMDVPFPKLLAPNVIATGVVQTRDFTHLTASGDIVIASDELGYVTKIHWPTFTILSQEFRHTSGSGGNGLILSNAASGIYCGMSTTGGHLQEYEIHSSSSDLRGRATGNNAGLTCGIVQDYLWVVRSGSVTGAIEKWRIVDPPITSEKTTYLQDGELKRARLIRMIDNPLRITHDTLLDAAVTTIPASSNCTVIDIMTYGEGIAEKGSISRYTT